MGFLATSFLNKSLEDIYNVKKTELEGKIGNLLDKDVELGKYSGLRILGFSFSNLRIIEKSDSNSLIEAAKVYVGIRPILSFLNQRWIIKIQPKNAKINITKDSFNKTTSITDLRGFNKNKINFDLNLDIKEFSNIKFNDVKLKSKIKGFLIYKSDSKQILGDIKADFQDKGNLRLKLNTFLNKDFLKLKIYSNGINLRETNYEIFDRKFALKQGILKSNFMYYRSQNNSYCKGNLSLDKLSLKTSNLVQNINSDSILFRCKNNNIVAQNLNINYGTLFSDFNLKIPLNKNINTINLKGDIGFLDRRENPDITLLTEIPYWVDKRGLNFGNINSKFKLNRTQLSNLNLFRNKKIRGYLSAKGKLAGNLSNPNLLINFNIDYPQYRGIKIKEIWEGEINNKNGEYLIKMNNRYSPVPSFLSFKFDSNISLENIIISRISKLNKGTLNIYRENDNYIWEANNFPLDEVQVSIENDEFDRISGNINGSGYTSKNAANLNGRFAWSLGEYRNIKFANSLFKFELGDEFYNIDSTLYPIDGGMIDIQYDSSKENTKIDFNNISMSWTLLTAIDIINFNNNQIGADTNSKFLNKVQINNSDKSFEEKIKFIEKFQSQNSVFEDRFNLKKYLTKFDGRYNAKLNVYGNDKANLKLETYVDGYILLNDKNLKYEKEKFSFNIEGGLFNGDGLLQIDELPLNTLNIFLDKHINFDGGIAFDLEYKLNEKNYFKTESINSINTSINSNNFKFESGFFEYKDEVLTTDLTLKYENSKKPITIEGSIPLSKGFKDEKFVLTIAGDKKFIDIIDILSEDYFNFRKGDVYFKFFIRGTINEPLVNGTLNLIDSEIDFLDTKLTNLNSTIILDFDEIEIFKFSADGEDSGDIKINGVLPLYETGNSEYKNISFKVNKINVAYKNFNAFLETDLKLGGTLKSPILGGDIGVSNGFYNFKKINIRNNKKDKFLEENEWDRVDLIEIISNESPWSYIELKKIVPNYLYNLSFNNLKLKLGPKFQLQYFNILKAYFDTSPPGVDLTINGKIKEEEKNKEEKNKEEKNKEEERKCGPLSARGRINLYGGRANLYTTPFKLDKNNDNHILLASRNCLVPYVDFSFISKVPESIIPINQNNKDNNISTDLDTNDNSKEFSAIGIGNTRLIKIKASYEGFLDELRSDKNLFLRSTPSYSRSQIISLIGGNSANLINRTFISQINSSNVFNERFQLYLYPALIDNNEPINNVFSEVDDTDESSSNDELSSQAWIAEIGLDITDRVNFAVQAIPDREDLPPLGILTLQANPYLELLGSMDSDGEWKSQVQLFFRY